MDKDIVIFHYPSTSKGLKCYKYTCLIYSLIELTLIILSATSALFLQFYPCITSIGLQSAVILSTSWMIYKSTYDSINLCLYLSPVLLLGTVILYPLIKTWTKASKALCSDIINYSSNTLAVNNCQMLLSSRSILQLVLMLEVAFRCIWIVVCFAGVRFKISLNLLVAEMKEKRRIERENEKKLASEKERRRKERQRKKVKDKVLDRNK